MHLFTVFQLFVVSGLTLYQKGPVPNIGIDVNSLPDSDYSRQLNSGMERVGLKQVMFEIVFVLDLGV